MNVALNYLNYYKTHYYIPCFILSIEFRTMLPNTISITTMYSLEFTGEKKFHIIDIALILDV